jgi:hypothetical protein
MMVLAFQLPEFFSSIIHVSLENVSVILYVLDKLMY